MQEKWMSQAWSDYLVWKKSNQNIEPVAKRSFATPTKLVGCAQEQSRTRLRGRRSGRAQTETRVLQEAQVEGETLYVILCRGHYNE
jgi:Txe/YoeB family toxin of Txe-Axe toxin-antitoxin module